MQLISTVDQFQKQNFQGGFALTIGNFDGVHLGHQFLIEKIRTECHAKGLKLVVMTFSPHPKTILLKDPKPFLINTYLERRDLLSNCGIDYLWEVPFNRDFSTLAPEDFLREKILFHPDIKQVTMGYDFAYGKDAAGNFEFAEKICNESNVKISRMDEYAIEKADISSSTIRNLVEQGSIEKVNEYLGRTFYLQGLVVKGEGRGRKIGFPTANIQLDPMRILPQRGVYISQTDYKGMQYQSVTNIGYNPTFNDGQQTHVETHIIDFDSLIYGEDLKVSFIKKLRDEKKFETVNDLIKQIGLDVEMAKKNFHA